MCLNPVRLRTNAKYFSLGSFKRFSMDVPCGQCAECQQMKKNEWYLRNYFEAEDTWKQGGYILFDTLTYKDEYLPSVRKTILGDYYDEIEHKEHGFYKIMDWMQENNLSDYDMRDINLSLKSNDSSCFDYHDVQTFLKRLRINLEREGYNVKSCLRYFLSSEYGHSDAYVDERGRHRVGTMRPHYHVLFYVTDPMLDPITLSSFVSDAWYLGRTDGYAYKGRAYVFNNTFGPRYIKDPNRLRGVQYYVTKYVTKDYEYNDDVDARICRILTDVYHLSMSSPEYSEKRRELHRYMDQFHRQSLGFGAQALYFDGVYEEIFNNGTISIPDRDKIKRIISVPMYYVRKLFQVCSEDSEGSLHWNWTDLGIQWKASRMLNVVSVLAQKMRDWYSNLSVYVDEGAHYRRKVDEILDGRTFEDYARYITYYRHRVYLGEVPTEDEVLSNSLFSCPECGAYVARKSGSGYVFNSLSGDEYFVSVDDMWTNCVMDDSVLPEFHGFDRLYSLYCASMRRWNDRLQEAYEKKLNEVKALKALGFKCKKSFEYDFIDNFNCVGRCGHWLRCPLCRDLPEIQ